MKIRGGDAAGAERALLRVPARFPRDSEPAAQSLFLVADLAANRGHDDSARTFFHAVAARYPNTPSARRAAFQAALIGFLGGKHRLAADEFDRLADRGGDESFAARYWAGRAYHELGDSAKALARWREVLGRSPDSYYALRASRRLGVPFQPFRNARDSMPLQPPDEPLARARRLEELGLRVEAKLELDAFGAAAGGAPDQLVGRALALSGGGWYARALRLSQRAQDRGAGLDRTMAELLYPLPFERALRGEAAAASVDPLLAAAVIRQESAFDPAARSSADARGLMQVLPAVGGQLARKAGLPEWDAALLFQPDVNLTFGIDHLARDLARLEWPERALAAYNAGYDRVLRWGSIRGIDTDPEVFVERIPFVETRDYVRRVTRNRAVYAALYPAAAP
jgi:soluble lytic murein transglycosylase